MPKEKFDFAGWVTKNDIRCADGITIKHNAFKDNDQKRVPLVWNHNHNIPNNILGHIILHNQPEGVYGYGFLNDSAEAGTAKELIKHGDISAMSIAANQLKKRGQDVIHGMIYEVSLVLAGANPGALIETIIKHSAEGDDIETDRAIVYPDIALEHSDEGEIEFVDNGGNNSMEKTIGDILDTLDEEQMNAVEALIAATMDDSEEDDEEDIEQSEDLEGLNHSQEGGETMKNNVFSAANLEKEEQLQHSITAKAILGDVMTGNNTLKGAMLEHGITNIEVLFPDATTVSGAPFVYRDKNTAGKMIVDATHKSPFARVKTIIADLTAESARARGYIKGNEKIDQVFSLLTRETLPQTVYKKQKLDRDDIVDITDFNVVQFINMEMRMMLIEEIGRAIMVGDGRTVGDASKIKEDKIRPIMTDADLYTIKVNSLTIADLIETIIKAMANYEGSGSPTLYTSPTVVADLRLLKGTDGRFLFGDIPSKEAIAARLGIAGIVESTFFPNNKALLVNLSDYTLGATKGGEITNFDDFDIDFNQYKYLIETRLSGSLTIPKSAIAINIGTPVA